MNRNPWIALLPSLLLAACPPAKKSPGGTTAACTGSESRCDGGCTDVQTDPNNCGACGTVCPAGQGCTAGGCACPAPSTTCGSQCVTVQTDATNCGACGKACRTGEVCQGGACVCQRGLSPCGAYCVDFASDVDNCGGCGKPCSQGEVCSAGACAAYCAGVDGGAALADCGGSCVDPSSNPNDCGGCGTACPPGQECDDGGCGCPVGQTLCDGGCLATDQNQQNCGGCGVPCQGWQTCQGGHCLGPDVWVSCANWAINAPPSANVLVGINSATGEVQAAGQEISAALDGGTAVEAIPGSSVYLADSKTLWVIDQENDQVDVLDVSVWPPRVAGAVAADPSGYPNQVLVCDGLVIVVNSGSNTIQGIDPVSRTTVQEVNLGAGKSPEFAACDGAHTLYVTDLGYDGVGGDVKSIDLSKAQWGDGGVTTLVIPANDSAALGDGGYVGPQPGGIAYVTLDGGSELLVTLENLNYANPQATVPQGPATLLVVDPALSGPLTAVSPGPSCENAQYLASSPSGDAVVETCTGNYDTGAGAAVASFSPATNQFGTPVISPIPSPGPTAYLQTGLVAIGGVGTQIALWNPADGGVTLVTACPPAVALPDGGAGITPMVAGITAAP